MARWQPIETAPSNVDVLLFCPDRGCDSNRARIELGCASHGWRNEAANNMSYHAWATHWMPLPAQPGAQTDDPNIAALHLAAARFALMWPGREPSSDTAWQAVVEAIGEAESR